PGPDRGGVAGPAGRVRGLERGVPAGQAVAAGRGVGPAVRRPPGRQPAGRGAAGVRRPDPPPGPPARPRRPKKADEAGEHLGRSRGGLTTKVHLACTDEDTAVAVTLTPGQAGDAPQFGALLDGAVGRVGVVDEVVADRGYDSHAIRDKVLDAGASPQVPS